MAGRIPPSFIDDLLARIDIVDLIGQRIALRKAGKDFQARCPFHDERTPSFTVSPDKQFYHCFGCGAHGTAIGFLMEHDRLAFREAVEELAQRVGLVIPSDGEPIRTGPDQGPLYQVLEQAAELYRQQLRSHPEAARAVDYLKGRGLTGEIAARYGLGYAPSGWDFLLSRLGRDPAGRQRLLQAGLITDQDGKSYDRLRERIVFPIRDRRGRVIGFGGRVLGDGKPKYLNSPETPVFHKGRELYGLYEAQKARRKLERLLVVEGYMDVIALAQFGIDYAVATLGTATTPEHLQLLLRSAPELVFCFDGDRAGRDAAWKALQTALPLATGNQSLRFLFLPEGEDPDTLVRAEGPGGLRAAARARSATLGAAVRAPRGTSRHDLPGWPGPSGDACEAIDCAGPSRHLSGNVGESAGSPGGDRPQTPPTRRAGAPGGTRGPSPDPTQPGRPGHRAAARPPGARAPRVGSGGRLAASGQPRCGHPGGDPGLHCRLPRHQQGHPDRALAGSRALRLSAAPERGAFSA